MNINILEQLRRLDTDSIQTVEDIVATLALAKVVRKEFEEHNSLVETPEFLDNVIRTLGRELKTKTADVLEKRLAEAKSKRAGLLTADEKRKLADEEIARLQAIRDKLPV